MTEIETNHTERLNLRLKPEDKQAFEDKARQQNKDLSEWARETLLASLSFEHDHRLMLAELMSLRNAIFRVLESFEGGKPLAPDSVSAIVADADKRKFIMADKRIASYIAEH